MAYIIRHEATNYRKDDTNNPKYFDDPNNEKLTKPVSLMSAGSRLSRQINNMLVYSKTSLMNGRASPAPNDGLITQENARYVDIHGGTI